MTSKFLAAAVAGVQPHDGTAGLRTAGRQDRHSQRSVRVYADYGGKWSFEAAKMAVEEFGGSVLGQKIEVVSADHQNKPDLGVSIARRWYEVENVDMITELTTSSVALAVHDLSKQMKKIDIVVGAATSRLSGDACQPYGFHWAYDTPRACLRHRRALVKAGRRYMVLHDRRLRVRPCA